MSSELFLSEHTENETLRNCVFSFQPNERQYLLPQLSVHLKEEQFLATRRTWRRVWIVQWGERKVVNPFFSTLQRGFEPKRLSLSTSLGLTLGVFPICGLALLMCAVAASFLQSRCHVPTLMLANFVVSPFEFGLVIPFMRVGELVMRDKHFFKTYNGLWEAIREHEPRDLVFGMLHAVLGWAIFAPFSIAFLYVSFLPVYRYLVMRFGHGIHLPVNQHVAIKPVDAPSISSPC